ncbi:MAG: hypothetical protein CMH52_14350 [Myxococcales bacterium]|nr:hypothetical protein [Myxococcales bacterium]
MAASATSVHSTAGDMSRIIVQCSHEDGDIKGATASTLAGGEVDILASVAANIPTAADNFPFLHCIADSGGTRTFTIAERVNDPC